MRGKKICNSLKKVRLDIAKANGIKLEIRECTHKGECMGTCPRCEAEVKYLERELEKRRKSGAKIVLAGVSAGLVAANAVSCGPIGAYQNLMGDVAIEESSEVSQTETAAESETTTDGAEETEELWLDGDVPYVPETDEEVFSTQGDIAYFPDTDLPPEIAGIMPAPEDFGDNE